MFIKFVYNLMKCVIKTMCEICFIDSAVIKVLHHIAFVSLLMETVVKYIAFSFVYFFKL